MYIKNRAMALLFRIVLLTGCGYGLAALSDILNGGYTHRMLAYYTNLSNIIVFAYIFVSAAHTMVGLFRHGAAGTSTFCPYLKRALVMMVTVTVLVYHFVLAPMVYRMNLNYEVYSLPDILVHYFTPLMFILDWLLFDKKNRVRWFDPLLWLLLPLSYLVFVLIRAEAAGPLNSLGVRYPYHFLDLDVLTTGEFLGNVLLCASVFTVVGYIYLIIDRLPAFFGGRSAKTGQITDIDV